MDTGLMRMCRVSIVVTPGIGITITGIDEKRTEVRAW